MASPAPDLELQKLNQTRSSAWHVWRARYGRDFPRRVRRGLRARTRMDEDAARGGGQAASRLPGGRQVVVEGWRRPHEGPRLLVETSVARGGDARRVPILLADEGLIL